MMSRIRPPKTAPTAVEGESTMTISEGQLAILRNPHQHTSAVVGRRSANPRNWTDYLERVRQLNDALCRN